MKYFLIILFSFLTTLTFSQVTFNKVHHDFGKLNGDEERFIDFYIKNNGNKEVFILSVRNPMEIATLRQTDRIMPDSSVVLRFQINKNSKGRFSYNIPVYTSDKMESTDITLVGSIESLPIRSNFTSCPNFNQKPSDGNPLDFSLTVQTIDKDTKKKLGGSTVAILQDGFALGKWKTEKNGRFKIRIPLGITYFYATHEGYYPAEEAAYVNFKNNLIILELEKKEEIIIPVIPEDVIVDIPTKEPEKEIEPKIIEEVEEEVVDIVIPEPIEEEEVYVEEEEEERIITIDLNDPPFVDVADIIEKEEEEEFIPPALKDLDEDNFDKEHFKPINITFIIDVSASMNQYGRMDLMKYSLNQLVGMLRPEDKIGIVAYAANAFEIMGSTCGDQKEEIYEEVKKLKASGHTDGYAGIKLGYKKVWRNRIKDGQNHVIIITDGGFNQNSGNYKKLIEKNFNQKDITMSVVGIKSNATAEKNMTQAAELGNGRFVLIENLSDAQTKLKNEIRLAAFRY